MTLAGYYGNYNADVAEDSNRRKSSSITPADLVFGHRFWAEQRVMEYLLEFLNVLAGYDYKLGVEGTRSYQRRKQLGLRRFVFLKDSPDAHDNDKRALGLLENALRDRLTSNAAGSVDPLEAARQLIRSFSAVDMNRSWFAKALFPVHQSFLMWEGYRKKPGKDSPVVESDSPSLLDDGFTLGTRNFFARSGEMVYLMLGAGTRSDPARRVRIANRLETILTANTPLGELAGLVEASWVELLRAEGGQTADAYLGSDTGTLGWLPDPDFPAFHRFAEDVDALLCCRLDAVEVMQMLLHLVGFHVTQYLYRRALKIKSRESDPTPTLLVDASDSGEERAIRHASVLSFKRNQELIVEATRRRLAILLAERLDKQMSPEEILEELFHMKRSEAADRFLDAAGHAADWIDYVPSLSETADQTIIAKMMHVVWEAYGPGFDSHFLPVHRRVSREIGLVAPRTGSGQRYVLGDTLLKALVLCNVKPGREVDFYGFVRCMFNRYGLIVGPDELGSAADWLQQYDVNRLYYQANMDAFRLKLKRAGLLTEYSDATAMVTNRTEPVA